MNKGIARDICKQHVTTSGTHQRGFTRRNRCRLSTLVTRLDARRTDLHRQDQRAGRTLCQKTKKQDEEEEEDGQEGHKEEEEGGEKSQKEGIQVESSDQRTTRNTHHESDDVEKSHETREMGKKDADGVASTERQVGGRTISQQENHAVEFIETDTHVKITSRGCCKQ